MVRSNEVEVRYAVYIENDKYIGDVGRYNPDTNKIWFAERNSGGVGGFASRILAASFLKERIGKSMFEDEGK